MRAVLLLALLTGCGERQIMLATLATNALIVCDVGQTYYASNGGLWDRPGPLPGTVQRELNPILGATPSPQVLTIDVGLGVAVNTAIGMSRLPRWLRWTYIGVVATIESYAVATHLNTAGVCGASGAITSR